MKFQITFKSTTEAQEAAFIEVYKTIPYDLVAAFKKLAKELNCDVVTTADKHNYMTEIIVIAK